MTLPDLTGDDLFVWLLERGANEVTARAIVQTVEGNPGDVVNAEPKPEASP